MNAHRVMAGCSLALVAGVMVGLPGVPGVAGAHPDHSKGGISDRPRVFEKYWVPRHEEMCDHTLSPALENFYGDRDDPRAKWRFTEQHRANGQGITYNGKTAYAAQMHIHGSMSEGTGSVETQTFEALNAGVDILWWSDHDHRITYHHHVSTFSFDDWCELWAVNENWTPILQFESGKYKSIGRVRAVDDVSQPCNVNNPAEDLANGIADFSDTVVSEGLRSFRLRADSEPGFFSFREWRWQFFSDGRVAWRRSLASNVTIDVSIFPTEIGADARPFFEVSLSDHLVPTSEGDADPFTYEPIVLRYYLTNTVAQPTVFGRTARIPLPFVRDWNHYTLDITGDVRALFEDIDGVEPFPYHEAADNSMHRMYFGIEARDGATCEAYFDGLKINETTRGDSLLDEQRAIAGRMMQRVPEVHQLHGSELSLTAPQHLTEFGPNMVLPDYDALAMESPYWDEATEMITNQGAFKEWLFHRLVQRARQAGGVVSYNHMWGGGLQGLTNQEMVDRLIANNAYGCDILEVGYRDRHNHTLQDYLWVWDELQKNGIYILGNGTSDLHGPVPGQWLTHGQNYVTWIFSESLDEYELIDAIKRGRMYFGDPRVFPEGMMDLYTSTGFRMGKIVLTDDTHFDAILELHGASGGAVEPDEVRVIVDGTPTYTYTANDLSPTVTLPSTEIAEGGSFVRFEVYRSNGLDKGFSNHLHFMNEYPSGGFSHHRAAFDYAGVHSIELDELTLTAVDRVAFCSGDRIDIDVHTVQLDDSFGTDGYMRLDLGDRGTPDSITLDRVTAMWDISHGRIITFTNISGRGTISMEWTCPGDINGDGMVNFDDLNQVLGGWAMPGVACDLTGDALLSFEDLNIVLANFGNSCQ